jgi:radical SAM protein with 4Fe4S-binding SPASM domain
MTIKNRMRMFRFIKERPNKVKSLAVYAVRKIFGRFRLGVRPLKYPETVYFRVTEMNSRPSTGCGQWANVYSEQIKKGLIGGAHLETGDWISLIRRIESWHPYVFIDGGEAPAHPGIWEILREVSKNNMLCGMRSNGFCLLEYAENIIAANLDYLLCSVDGFNKKDSEFTSVMHGIAKVLKLRDNKCCKFPVVQITALVNKDNYASLYDMAKMAEDFGIDTFAVSFPVFTTTALGRATNSMHEQLLGVKSAHWMGCVADYSDIDCGIAEEQLQKIRSRKWRFEYRQFPTKECFCVYTHFNNPETPFRKRVGCPLPFQVITVLPNGDVATCWDHPDYITGNVKETPLIDIWRNEKYRVFRNFAGKNVFPSCARCNGFYYS